MPRFIDTPHLSISRGLMLKLTLPGIGEGNAKPGDDVSGKQDDGRRVLVETQAISL